jgi:hypothetical protein
VRRRARASNYLPGVPEGERQLPAVKRFPSATERAIGALQMVAYHHGDVSEHGQKTRQKRRNDQFHDFKSLQGVSGPAVY